ncbi:MAG: universal stress protein [Chloroflexi bacterium]|nr:universal stress protein [Chloroflexota bacterium]
MFNHLLVPLDGSPFAEKALPYALEIAEKCNAKITLVHVIPPGQWEWEAEMRAELPEGEESAHQHDTRDAANYLKKQEEELREQGYDVTALLVKDRAVDKAIIETAKSENADTIIMTTHGLTGLQRRILGSVAEKVTRHAPVPILLIRVESS